MKMVGVRGRHGFVGGTALAKAGAGKKRVFGGGAGG